MSLIPPLFHGNEYVTDFKKKAELFNSIFATQCSLKSNTSEVSFNLHYTTEKRLDAVNCSTNDIDEIIQNLDPNKAHGHNKLSTRMMEIYSKSICKPLELMLNRHTNTSSFPLVDKEVDKQYLKNKNVVSQTPYQKQLGIFLHVRLTFQENLKVFTAKVNKTIGLLRKLRKISPRPVLTTICTDFVGRHLDYGDAFYNKG